MPLLMDTERSREETSLSGCSGQKAAPVSLYSQGAVTVKGLLVRVRQPQVCAKTDPNMPSRVRGVRAVGAGVGEVSV